MNCLLLLCLSGLYVEGGVGVFDQPPKPPQWAFAKYGPDAHWKYDANEAANPRGRISVGHEWEVGAKWRFQLELRHESWIGTSADYGQNSAWGSVRYRPFR